MTKPLNQSKEYMQLVARQLAAHERSCTAYLLKPLRPLAEVLRAKHDANVNGCG